MHSFLTGDIASDVNTGVVYIVQEDCRGESDISVREIGYSSDFPSVKIGRNDLTPYCPVYGEG